MRSWPVQACRRTASRPRARRRPSGRSRPSTPWPRTPRGHARTPWPDADERSTRPVNAPPPTCAGSPRTPRRRTRTTPACTGTDSRVVLLPSRSWTKAAITHTTNNSPRVSVTTNRLRPLTFLLLAHLPHLDPVAADSRVGPWRLAVIAHGRFPRPALRTRRAPFSATGSP